MGELASERFPLMGVIVLHLLMTSDEFVEFMYSSSGAVLLSFFA